MALTLTNGLMHPSLDEAWLLDTQGRAFSWRDSPAFLVLHQVEPATPRVEGWEQLSLRLRWTWFV